MELIPLKQNEQDILLVTKYGQCIRFSEQDVRSTGRVSMGVRGINLLEEDEVIGMQLTCQGDYLLIVSEKGLGKRTSVGEFTRQNRGGKGVKCYKITEKTGNVILFFMKYVLLIFSLSLCSLFKNCLHGKANISSPLSLYFS